MSSFRQLKHNPAVIGLLTRIVDRAAQDLPGALGLSVVARDEHGFHVLAHRGDVESAVMQAQLHTNRGPVPDALRHQVPVLSVTVLTDDRWPELGRAITDLVPAALDAVGWQIAGVAAVPGPWGDDAVVALSATLSRPATAATVTTLIGYEQLITAALIAATADLHDAMTVVQSRAVIEQAKGAVMGRLGCDAGQAFAVLKQASQHTNVKLRALAVALVEHIGSTPAQQPESACLILVDEADRLAAQRLWSAVGEIVDPVPDADGA